jgi:hypothetical protein
MTSFNNNSILDTSSSRYIKLQVQYGGDLYELLLTSKDNQIRVEHVLDEIEKLLKVPKSHQSIMYKGQRLDHKPKANLDDLYIFNNSKLILTGRQKQIHEKYSSLDQIITSIPKSISSEEKLNLTIKSKEDINDSLITKTQSSSVVPKKQEIHSNPIGFTPDPNKNYE